MQVVAVSVTFTGSVMVTVGIVSVRVIISITVSFAVRVTVGRVIVIIIRPAVMIRVRV